MAQAQIQQEGYFKAIEFPIDENLHVCIRRKKGQPVIGLYKRTKHGRLGIQLTPEQLDNFKSMLESIPIALSLIGTGSDDGSTDLQGSPGNGDTSI